MQVLLGDPVNESTVTMAETIAWQGRQNVTHSTLVAQVEQSACCVCVSVCADLWPRYGRHGGSPWPI